MSDDPDGADGADGADDVATPYHVTSVFESSEFGILLRGSGEHRIHVLGAAAEAHLPDVVSKEPLHDPVLDEILERYFSGELAPEPDDPDHPEFTPDVPKLFITADGEPHFLRRDLSPASPRGDPPVPGPPPCPPLNAPAWFTRWHGLLGPAVRCGNDVVELIDGPETFRAMHAAINTATSDDHYIYLLGWWLDLDVPLDVPVSGAVCPPPAGPSTIRSLFTAASGRGVEIRAMLWDQSLSTKNTAEVNFIDGLANGAAVLDNHQYAFMVGSHHQKVLVVKGSEGLIGFCGGVDINLDRICAPAGGGSGSGGSSGGPGAPLHDVHCRIHGPAAIDLLDVFRRRWAANPAPGAGALLGAAEPVPGSSGTSMVRVGATMNMNNDGSGRTRHERDAQEILLTVIANARRYLYIEEQYLMSMCAAEAIRAALAHLDHVTILIPASELTGDIRAPFTFRRRFIDHILTSPHGAKLRVFELCPTIVDGQRVFGPHTYVHAKMMIADDEIAVIGSANMNRRGWEHDSEVVAAIVGPAGDDVSSAKHLRQRLWAEHLGVFESAVDDPIASKGLWTTAPLRRVCPYDRLRSTDSTRIRESVIDPPAPAGPGCPHPIPTRSGGGTSTSEDASGGGADPVDTADVPATLVQIDVDSAVPQFADATRRTVVQPLLTPAQSADAIAWNTTRHDAQSGVTAIRIRAALARYVQAADVQAAIDAFNAANPSDTIAAGTAPVNALFVESVHQFQRKCFREPSQHDGKAGESTLDSLGLIERTGLHSWNQVNRTAQDRLDRAGARVAAATGNEFTAADWGQHMANPSVFGETFNRGIHLVLLRKLRVAERHLLTLPAYHGMTPVEMGTALGIAEQHKGTRRVETGSIHTFGLALDIGYLVNPYVKDTSSRDALRNAVLLTSGGTLTRARITQEFDAIRTDADVSTATAYDEVAALHSALREYLGFESDPDGLLAAVRARVATGTAGVLGGGESEASAVARWRRRIVADRRALAAGNWSGRRPQDGFLNLPKDLVVALRDEACLIWGGIDLGTGASGSGDMMHFDARLTAVGTLLAGIPGPSGRNFVLDSGHPCLDPGDPPPDPDEGGDE